ncbi:hypothetical protein C6A85_40315, partial [Mycobacterium sp. ITM-2017-0098]
PGMPVQSVTSAANASCGGWLITDGSLRQHEHVIERRRRQDGRFAWAAVDGYPLTRKEMLVTNTHESGTAQRWEVVVATLYDRGDP